MQLKTSDQRSKISLEVTGTCFSAHQSRFYHVREALMRFPRVNIVGTKQQNSDEQPHSSPKMQLISVGYPLL